MTGNMMLIGVSGYARSGKDTVADYLVSRHGFTKFAFADKVRETAQLFGDDVLVTNSGQPTMTYNDAVTEFSYEGAKERYPEGVRKYLVKIGHGLRGVLGDSLWLDQVFQNKAFKSKASEIGCRIVISDCRYLNEADEVIRWRNGDVLVIDRPGVLAANETESTNQKRIDEYFAPTHILNDGTLEQLYANVDSFINKLSTA
jgi:hypothetical protein